MRNHSIAPVLAALLLLLLGAFLAWEVYVRNAEYNDGYGHIYRATPDPAICEHPDGIDVSHHNEAYDWGRVSAKFVYMRATTGCDTRDTLFERHLRRARTNGLNVGAYHFLTALTSADEQFANFASAVDPRDVQLRPMLDVEDSRYWRAPKGFTPDDAHRLIRRWADLCKAHYGKAPIIYITENIYHRYGLDEGFDDCLWWVAAYTTQPDFEEKCTVPFTLHQYSSESYVEGFYDYVDCDRFHSGATMADLLL